MAKTPKGGRLCKNGKVNEGKNKRCVKPCTSFEKRRHGVGRCVTKKKPGYVLNKLTNRWCSKEGRTGQWVLGKTDTNPRTGMPWSYRKLLARKRAGS